MRNLLTMGRPGDLPFTLPTGTLTFLIANIEGSAESGAGELAIGASSVARYEEILDQAIAAHNGLRPAGQPPQPLVAAFSRASDAVATAIAAQREIVGELGDTLRVRMALHTGESQLRHDGNDAGHTVLRTARLQALGHGGQVLVSRTTADLAADTLPANTTLTDLGDVRLRDLGRHEHVFQLTHPALPHVFPKLRTLDDAPTNLPIPLTSLIGRERELIELADLVEGHRLVTITGVGGVGKTRLAAQLGADLVDRFAEGVWWVELAGLGNGDGVAAAVLEACGGAQAANLSAAASVVARLSSRRALLIIDNCEHVLDTVGALVDDILRRCPDVRVIATSREPLGVPGEVTWRVPSLSSPPDGPVVAPDSLRAYDAVRLFIDRARLARPHFIITEANAALVADICQRLDGIPLAIELAAARVRQMPVERIAAGLDDRFRLLTGGARTLMPRQQTLEASIEWSYDLLDGEERAVFNSLGAFVNGFGPDAVERVATYLTPSMDSYDVFDTLSRLVDKSLVVAGDDGRYRLLETMRSFAITQSRAAGQLDALRDAHLAWATWLVVERWDFNHRILNQSEDGELQRELPNLAAALEWSMRPGSNPSLVLLRPLARGWYETSRLDESARWARRFMAEPDASVRQFGCAELSTNALFAGVLEIRPIVAESYADARERGDRYLQMRASRQTALSAPLDEGEAILRDALQIARDDGDQTAQMELLLLLGVSRARQGDLDEAGAMVDEVDELVDWQHPLIALARLTRAMIARFRGDKRTTLATALAERIAGLPAHGFLLIAGILAAVDLGDDDAFALLYSRAENLPPTGTPGAAKRLITAVHTYVVAGDAAGAATIIKAEVLPAGLGLDSLAATELVVDLALVTGDDELRKFAMAPRPGHRSFLGDLTLTDDQLALDPTAERWPAAHDLLDTAINHGFHSYAVSALEHLGVLELLHGRSAIGLQLFGAAEADRLARGERRRLPGRQALLDTLIEQHGPLPADRLSLSEAIALAQRARGERGRPTTGWDSLTPTERDVAELVAGGLSNPAIGTRLIMSPNTVKTHLSHIFTKLDMSSRAELAARVAAEGKS